MSSAFGFVQRSDASELFDGPASSLLKLFAERQLSLLEAVKLFAATDGSVARIDVPRGILYFKGPSSNARPRNGRKFSKYF